METITNSHANLTQEQFDNLVLAKDERRTQILETMTQISEALVTDGISHDAEITPGWKDVNSFFPFGDEGEKILHVRLSPVLDNANLLTISIRELDKEKMLEERKRTSTGDEHLAEIRRILEPSLIPNDRVYITGLIKAELPAVKVLA